MHQSHKHAKLEAVIYTQRTCRLINIYIKFKFKKEHNNGIRQGNQRICH